MLMLSAYVGPVTNGVKANTTSKSIETVATTSMQWSNRMTISEVLDAWRCEPTKAVSGPGASER